MPTRVLPALILLIMNRNTPNEDLQNSQQILKFILERGRGGGFPCSRRRVPPAATLFTLPNYGALGTWFEYWDPVFAALRARSKSPVPDPQLQYMQYRVVPLGLSFVYGN